jgi:aminoglycoside 3-N-acetyltransferase
MQETPWTRDTIAQDIGKLGVPPGATLLVHSSLRSLGWVCGGATSVVQALLDSLGPTGTLVVPALTPDNRDPSRWTDPPAPQAWWQVIRDNLPGFDPLFTPSVGVGVIPERVRTWPGAVRSTHPQTSFAALGPRAEWLVERHDLDCQLGEASPLGRLEQDCAWVLLLGVGFDRCTAFHLAEYRLPNPPTRENSCAIMTPEGRRWVTYTGIALDDSDFAELGRDFEAEADVVVRGSVGLAEGRLFPIRDAVAYAQRFRSHRRRGSREDRRLGASGP